MALEIILLHNTCIKEELKACVQSFSFFHQMIALKVELSTSKKIRVTCFIKIPLKMIKNAFYFILKTLFILKMFIFLVM